jgi:hypothetical protein
MEQAPNLRILATSRDESDIRYSMQQVNCVSISITNEVVDADTRRYIKTQMSRNRKPSDLNATTKSLVEKTLTARSDGMHDFPLPATRLLLIISF